MGTVIYLLKKWAGRQRYPRRICKAETKDSGMKQTRLTRIRVTSALVVQTAQEWVPVGDLFSLGNQKEMKATNSITLQFPRYKLSLLKCRAKSMGLSLSAYCAKLIRQELERQGYLKD